jgi:zinc protease
MAVMVVGDVEPKQAEKLIQQHFGKLKNPAKPRPRLYAEVPQRSQTEALVITDKEAPDDTVFIRYPIRPAQEPVTIADYRRQMIENLYSQMLSARMQELTQQANRRSSRAAAAWASWCAAMLVQRVCLAGQGRRAAGHRRAGAGRRAARRRFSQDELDRAKDMLRNYERAYSERDKSDSSGFAAEYSRNFLEQEAIPGIANELLYAQELLPQVTLAGNQRDGGQGHPRPAKKAGVFMGAEPKAGDAASERRRSSNCSMPWRKPSSKPSSRARKKVLASKLMPDSLPAGGAASSKSSTAPSA